MSAFSDSVEGQWYSQPHWLLLFAPVAALFILLSFIRRWRYKSNPPTPLPVPIVIVGNITVGGTGKTPIILSIVSKLKASGFRPGIIARGYGVELSRSRLVSIDASASEVGDEPLLLAKLSGCPVAVGPHRVESVHRLITDQQCNIILSDDGLQHYALWRDIELVVIDATRKLGNGWRLPVGPLRESSKRLQSVDFVVVNGEPFAAPWLAADKKWAASIKPKVWRNVKTGKVLALDELTLNGAQAVAAIGNPQRFFDTLADLGFSGPATRFPDHHAFSEVELDQLTGTVLMTEKDAVKCQAFAKENWWALSVEMVIDEAFWAPFMQKILAIKK